MNNRMLGIINAGEENRKLRDLVRSRSTSALPVGGRYRAVDFLISNMVNAGIKNIGLLTRKNYDSLLNHVGSGKAYGLNRKNDGLYIFPPYITGASVTGEYTSVMDGLRGTLNFLRKAKEEYVLLGRSYVVFNADFNDMLDKHIKSDADISVMYFDIDGDETNVDYDGVYMKTDDESGQIINMCYSDGKQRSNKKNMDVYIMKRTLLIDLIEDAVAHNKKHFFFDVIIPNFDRLKIQGYEFKGYVGCITSVEAYYNVNMDLLKPEVIEELFHGRPIYTRTADGSPAKYGKTADVSNSLICSGCEIDGKIENSIVFRGSQISEGAVVKNSIVMAEGFIAKGAEIDHTILDRHVKVYSNAHLAGSSNHPVFIPKGASINE
ncbi:glucose-1-phosphate adenylyltransferase subunit GlgD [Anaerostipes faecalis]|uniref:glucose-1-phosphate adenylyltransferase subunit GlgD n=1 Tax=Anaerostipes faecalis TaxID=2738446 RepID=UPI003F074CA8